MKKNNTMHCALLKCKTIGGNSGERYTEVLGPVSGHYYYYYYY